MSGEASTTIIGNVGGDPELRFTPSGDAVASFTLANTPRVKTAGGDWEDGETTWYRITSWKRDAEAVAEHVRKGDRVRVTGRLKVSTYEARDGGGTRVGLDVTADMEGVSIVPRPVKKGDAAGWSAPAPAQGGADPWATEEPPF